MQSLKWTWTVLLFTFLLPIAATAQDEQKPPTTTDTEKVQQVDQTADDDALSEAPPVIAQGLEIDQRVSYLVKGIENARIFNKHIVVDKIGEKVEYEPVGFVRIRTAAANVEIEVTNIKREPVKYEEWQPGLIVIRKSGKFWVEITAIDFAKNIYKKKTIVLEIGEVPDTPDEPDKPDEPDEPDTPIDPDGAFDGLAAKVAKFKSKIQIDKRNQVINVFETAADKMQQFQFRQLKQALDYIVKNRPSATGDKGLTGLYKLLAEDSGKRTLSWEETQTYYREVVKGLR